MKIDLTGKTAGRPLSWVKTGLSGSEPTAGKPVIDSAATWGRFGGRAASSDSGFHGREPFLVTRAVAQRTAQKSLGRVRRRNQGLRQAETKLDR